MRNSKKISFLLTIIFALSAINTVYAVGVIGTIRAGGILAYDSGKGEVFVANNNKIQIISDSSNEIIETVPIGGLVNANALAYDSGKGEIFIAAVEVNANGQEIKDSGAVFVMSDSNNKVIATVHVGGYPTSLAYDSGKGEIFVSNTVSYVSIISDRTNSVVAKAKLVTGGEAENLIYDPKKNEVFVLMIDVIVSNAIVANVAIWRVEPYSEMAYDPVNSEVLVPSVSGVTVISDTSNTELTFRSENTSLFFTDIPLDAWGGILSVTYDTQTDEIFTSNDNVISTISDSISDSNYTLIARTYLDTNDYIYDMVNLIYDSGKSEVFASSDATGHVYILSDYSNSSASPSPTIIAVPNPTTIPTPTTTAVPEFPAIAVLPLLLSMFFVAVVAVIIKHRKNR